MLICVKLLFGIPKYQSSLVPPSANKPHCVPIGQSFSPAMESIFFKGKKNHYLSHLELLNGK